MTLSSRPTSATAPPRSARSERPRRSVDQSNIDTRSLTLGSRFVDYGDTTIWLNTDPHVFGRAPSSGEKDWC
jgi:hypothetical protein